MDGHFVPNLTIGPPVVESLRERTDLFLDCHLMVDNPGVLLDDFADAGADRCIVHVELGDPRPLFDELRARDVGVGLVLEPADAGRRGAAVPRRDRPAAGDEREPGLGGQAFIPEVLDKVRGGAAGDRRARARRWRSRSTAASTSTPRAAAAAAGVDILVAGSAMFRAPRSGRGGARDPRRGRAGAGCVSGER